MSGLFTLGALLGAFFYLWPQLLSGGKAKLKLDDCVALLVVMMILGVL